MELIGPHSNRKGVRRYSVSKVDHARATLRLVLVSPLLIRDQVWRRAAA
jgi:hypothetical protein